MAHYYASLLRKLPGLLVDSAGRVFTVPLLALTVVLWFNHPLGQRLVTAWSGVDPTWALVPIAGLVVYGIARANYEAVKERDERIGASTASNEELRAELANRGTSVRSRLDGFMQQGNALLNAAVRTADDGALAELEKQISGWATAVRDYLDEQETGHAGLFMSESVPMTQYSVDGFQRWSLLTNFLRRRLHQLGEIVKRY